MSLVELAADVFSYMGNRIPCYEARIESIAYCWMEEDRVSVLE